MKDPLEYLLRRGNKAHQAEALSLDLQATRDVRFTLNLQQDRFAGAALHAPDSALGRDGVLCHAQAPVHRCRIDQHQGWFWCGDVRFKIPLRELHRVYAWLQAAREAT